MDDDERNEFVKVISSKRTITSNNFELIREIANFYERDDISRMSPKAKDMKKHINKQTGAEELFATRHMIVTLREAYALFMDDKKTKNEGMPVNIAYVHDWRL